MAEMGSAVAHSLAILQAFDILPDNFLISEAWPSMSLAFVKELFSSSASWCYEEGLASDRVIVGHLLIFVLSALCDPRDLAGECISGMLCVMTIEVADFVGCLEVTTES